MLLATQFAGAVRRLLSRYGITVVWVADQAQIPGSYWGDSEAGLQTGHVFARSDTPLHSILHEAAHYICMPPERRCQLDTDAGGDDAEECAVCFLQLQLATQLGPAVRNAVMADMDQWGYSFRLGSTRAWLNEDSDAARLDLHNWGLIDANGQPTHALRC